MMSSLSPYIMSSCWLYWISIIFYHEISFSTLYNLSRKFRYVLGPHKHRLISKIMWYFCLALQEVEHSLETLTNHQWFGPHSAGMRFCEWPGACWEVALEMSGLWETSGLEAAKPDRSDSTASIQMLRWTALDVIFWPFSPLWSVSLWAAIMVSNWTRNRRMWDKARVQPKQHLGCFGSWFVK